MKSSYWAAIRFAYDIESIPSIIAAYKASISRVDDGAWQITLDEVPPNHRLLVSIMWAQQSTLHVQGQQIDITLDENTHQITINTFGIPTVANECHVLVNLICV